MTVPALCHEARCSIASALKTLIQRVLQCALLRDSEVPIALGGYVSTMRKGSKGNTPRHYLPGRQKHGPGDVAEGYAAGLARAQVAALDEQLVRLKGAISHVTLACIRQRIDAANLVRALLADVDGVRKQLVETEAEQP